MMLLVSVVLIKYETSGCLKLFLYLLRTFYVHALIYFFSLYVIELYEFVCTLYELFNLYVFFNYFWCSLYVLFMYSLCTPNILLMY